MVLSGWKDIAKYVGRRIRSVQRWERLGLHIRRPTPARRGVVIAFSEEIDAWLKSDPDSEIHFVTRGSESARSQRFRYRILLVDDNESLLVSLGEILSYEGYEVHTARDGFEALAAMRGGIPDLLISDLRMPNMSGFELLSVVRRRFPAVAVIALSWEFTPAADPVLICDSYIGKGRNAASKLIKSVRELLSRSPLRTQPAKIDAAPAWLPRSIEAPALVKPGVKRQRRISRPPHAARQ